AAVAAAGAGVAAAALNTAALVAADLATAVFAEAVLAAAVFAAALLVAAVLAAVDLAAAASTGVRDETAFAVDADFAAPVRAALVGSAGSAPVAFAAGPSAVDPAAVVDRAAVGRPAVDPAGFTRDAVGRAAAGLRTADFRTGFGFSSGTAGDVASAAGASCRAGSLAPARAPGVGSSGSESGGVGVTSLTYQGPSDTT
ncbi:MAG: hypothetical protein ABIX44_09975, partial [Cryobacterium sp.]